MAPIRFRLIAGDPDLVALNQREVLTALIAEADPNAPPTEDEILSLILGEMAFLGKGRFRAPRSGD